MVVLSIAIAHACGSWNSPRKRTHDNADQSDENTFMTPSKMPNINTGNPGSTLLHSYSTGSAMQLESPNEQISTFRVDSAAEFFIHTILNTYLYPGTQLYKAGLYCSVPQQGHASWICHVATYNTENTIQCEFLNCLEKH